MPYSHPHTMGGQNRKLLSWAQIILMAVVTPSHLPPWRHHCHLTCVQSRLPPRGWWWCCEGTALTLCLPLSGFPARPSPSGCASSICGNLLAERKRAESPSIWIWNTRRGLGGYGRELFSTLLPITTHLYSPSYTGVSAELCYVSCGPSEGGRKEEAAQSRVST